MSHGKENGEPRLENSDIAPEAIITELRHIAVQWQEEVDEIRNEPQLREREVGVLAKLEAALAAGTFAEADKPGLIAALEQFAKWIDTIPVIQRVDTLLEELRRI